MANGYEIEFSDGTLLKVVPHPNTSCSISHGDIKIEFADSKGSFHVTGASRPLEHTIVRFEHKQLDISEPVPAEAASKNIYLMRKCMTCNGRSCCVTGGCVNCGCLL